MSVTGTDYISGDDNLPACPAVSAWRPLEFSGDAISLIEAADAAPILPQLDLWDNWPLADEAGQTVTHGGRQYWFFLSAPRLPDPGLRHNVARIRLASLGPDGWRDHGHALPDGLNPGAREWAGSAVLHDDGHSVTLFFTAAGRPQEPLSVEQRLFSVAGTLGADGPGGWSEPVELVQADRIRYVETRGSHGEPGMIKGFRDPAWFRDPATGLAHILFTASAAWSHDPFNGIIGLATWDGSCWHLDDPLIEAIGVNNELERPHVLVREGRYYLFWSTQRRTFAPAAVAGPNGLYAMVADNLNGPWRPVNNAGLVAANPPGEPTQGYSWWTTRSGEVWSFVDHWGMKGRQLDSAPELLRQQFGGTPAPVFRLAFAGDRITIVR